MSPPMKREIKQVKRKLRPESLLSWRWKLKSFRRKNRKRKKRNKLKRTLIETPTARKRKPIFSTGLVNKFTKNRRKTKRRSAGEELLKRMTHPAPILIPFLEFKCSWKFNIKFPTSPNRAR